MVVPNPGAGSHALLTRAPLAPGPKPARSFDLHVLSAPPAFVLSQDQTLSLEPVQTLTDHLKGSPEHQHPNTRIQDPSKRRRPPEAPSSKPAHLTTGSPHGSANQPQEPARCPDNAPPRPPPAHPFPTLCQKTGPRPGREREGFIVGGLPGDKFLFCKFSWLIFKINSSSQY